MVALMDKKVLSMKYNFPLTFTVTFCASLATGHDEIFSVCTYDVYELISDQG